MLRSCTGYAPNLSQSGGEAKHQSTGNEYRPALLVSLLLRRRPSTFDIGLAQHRLQGRSAGLELTPQSLGAARPLLPLLCLIGRAQRLSSDPDIRAERGREVLTGSTTDRSFPTTTMSKTQTQTGVEQSTELQSKTTNNSAPETRTV